jgi:predicted nucleic acid-binding protein
MLFTHSIRRAERHRVELDALVHGAAAREVSRPSIVDRWVGIEECVPVVPQQPDGCKPLLSEDLQRGQAIDGLVTENPFRGGKAIGREGSGVP